MNRSARNDRVCSNGFFVGRDAAIKESELAGSIDVRELRDEIALLRNEIRVLRN